MQVFEFHFNPKKDKSDSVFDSFCFEPENLYEKRMGSLYLVGLLKNVLPQNVLFLDNLAKKIKEHYYQTVSATPERSLRETLKKANEYLEKIARQGNVSWLGNLNFAVLSLKNFELNFTKVGNLKIFLLRKGQIIDIDQKLRFEDIEPYPLKIFGNIVSGKLTENDSILVLSEEAEVAFLQENLLTRIANLSPFESKKLKAILNGKKEKLTKITGIAFLIFLSKEVGRKEKETLAEKKRLKIFSLKEPLRPLVKFLRLPKVSLKTPLLSFPKVKLPSLPQVRIKTPRKINLILFLFLFLVLGLFIFEKKEEKELAVYRNQLTQIQEKTDKASSFLILAKTNPQAQNEANSLLKEAWAEISPLLLLAPTFPSDLASQVSTLKETITGSLYQINKVEIVEEPEIFFEFKAKGFIPQKIIFFRENLYFFSPYSENIFEINQKKEANLISINQKFHSAVTSPDSLLFLAKPRSIFLFQEGQFKESPTLQLPYSEADFNQLSSYQSNLYFLDNANQRIIKYPYLTNNQWGLPQLWLENKKAKDFKSMAVDGSLWVLTKENSIERYYAGRLQETLNLEIFPSPEIFSKIFTASQLPYLYILEPSQKRILILSKSGQIVKQFQSEKFDNLLDFAVSENLKAIWLLNGLKVYKINL